MTFIDPLTGRCISTPTQPGGGLVPVVGRGMLFRRRRAHGFEASYGFGPDLRLWVAQGWERVRFVPAAAMGPVRKGGRSGLAFAFAPPVAEEVTGKSKAALWVVLPEETGLEAPADRPGAQALFARETLARGAPAEELAERLLTSRIAALGLPIEAARWALKGPHVSPADARLVQKLRPVLALAERLAADLVAAFASGDVPAVETAPSAPAGRTRRPRSNRPPRPPAPSRRTSPRPR